MTKAQYHQRAVFLSYASQDRSEVARLAEALRGGGMEVWFDQAGGLEHGDEWDEKIRRQIKDCVLFIAVVSANTQARLEGYFRIEWELAAERAQGIARGVPFILPVIIDDTPEEEALVPDRFRKVHWTRLPGGEVPAPVQKHFVNLWLRRITPAAESKYLNRPPLALSGGMPVTAGPPPRRKYYWWGGVAAAAFIGLGAWGLFQRFGAKLAESAPPSRATDTSSANMQGVDSKSLVVLPFENLSPDPANAYFTDGLHSEIIAALSRISELKVISRISALKFRGSTESLAAIAEKLKVANVISGSVQRSQDNVRVTLELRRASDEVLLWSPTPYDRKAEDVLAVQSEIANEVARVLQARQAIGTAESARLFTKNPSALELFTKAKEMLYIPNLSLPQRRESIRLLEEALKLDPDFWYAAAFLSVAHTQLNFLPQDEAARAANAAAAKRWAEEAIRLAPPGMGGGALAYYLLCVEEDAVRGLAIAQENVRALPGDAERHNLVVFALDTLGRADEALAAVRRALEYDPFNANSRYYELNLLLQLRRTDKWDGLLERYLADFAMMRNRELVDSLSFRMHGKLPEKLTEYLPHRQVFWLVRGRQFEEAARAADTFLSDGKLSPLARFEVLLNQAWALRHLGRKAPATAAANATLELAEQLAADKADPRRDAFRLSYAYAVNDRVEEAIEAGKRNLEAVSAKNNVKLRWEREEEFARLCARVGRVRDAVNLVKHLLEVPSGLLIPALKVDPDWDNLRGDAAFNSLLANPALTKPL